MKFGDKLRKLREQRNLTQSELSQKAGVSLRTVQYYESGKRYPQKREIYSTLADIFDVDVNYLLTEGEEFVAVAREEYGYRGAKGAEKLINGARALFAGGELSDEDKQAVLIALQEAYFEAKRENKKYTPKKYRKGNENDK
ncbi:MAG: helix-turn-helix transcriptional regulator [Thermoanaerobacterales bacterium]|jgi:transcriptional regulator with XRE-family HTH domain|nr:helix-turn-helix transcriptional regulator [Thermoanaerobacterales bacterium]